MVSKVLSCVAISTQSHGIDLSLGPFVQIEGSDKGGMNAHASVRGGTIQTQKDAYGGFESNRRTVLSVNALENGKVLMGPGIMHMFNTHTRLKREQYRCGANR